MLVRRNRLITRISLILVLCIGLFGGWYASRNWVPEIQSSEIAGITEEVDWIDLLAGVGEEAVQLLMGVTSGE
jgi:hypothetical protein